MQPLLHYLKADQCGGEPYRKNATIERLEGVQDGDDTCSKLNQIGDIDGRKD